MSARSNAAAVDEQATVTLRLHGVQHDINNLRLLNVCLQSTLLRVQTQLTDCLPANADDEIKRNCVKQTIASLRAADDRNRRVVLRQQRSLAQLFGYFSKSSQVTARVKQCSLDKSENQVELLHSMFLELHAVIHTEHNDRINQMYIALTETSKSVQQAQETLDKTIDAHRRIARKRMQRKFCYLALIMTFISSLVLIIGLSIRLR